jgi:pimeloyl-ACP methyl ester carboxylesterase
MDHLHYTDMGKGPTVVLLHALLLDKSLFDHQAKSLASHGFRVIVPDYAGHGLSSRIGSASPTVGCMADQVFELLEGLNVQFPVTLGGLSMGGYVAFAAWAKYRERISRMILMDTRAVPDTEEESRNRYRASDLIRQAGSVGPLAVTMLPKLLGRSTIKHRPEVWKQVAGILDRTSVESACDALAALATRPDRRPLLPSIDVPALVIVGQEDQISTSSEMAEMAEALPRSQFVELPSVGHLASLEDPESVSKHMLEFLMQSFEK